MLRRHHTQHHPNAPILPISAPTPTPTPAPTPTPHLAATALPLPADYPALVSHLSQGLHFLHPSWITPARTILTSLLTQCSAPSLDTADANIAAFQLFPGALERCRSTKMPKPIDFLHTVLASPDYATAILRYAHAELPHIKAFRARTRPTPNAETMRAEVESLITKGKRKLAAKRTACLDRLLRGIAEPPPLEGHALQAMIDSLHPEPNEMDLLPPSSEDPLAAPFSINAGDLLETVNRLDTDSASGTTGWTNHALKTLFGNRSDPHPTDGLAEPSPLLVAWASFANRTLAGLIGGVGRQLLVAGRITIVSKDNGTGHRPICIECCATRAIGATGVRAARKTIPTLLPLQFGGGVPNGAEIVARLDDIAFHSGLSVLSIDVKNAFNSTRLSVIYRGLLETSPQLLPYFRWKYGSPSELRNNAGSVVALTRTGVRQGCPWGTFLFEAALQPTLRRLLHHLIDLECTHNLQNPTDKVTIPGSVAAFEDDTLTRAKTAIIFKLAPLISNIFAEDGFIINPDKCKITGTDVHNYAHEAPDGFLIQEHGLTALGVPIGDAGYRTETVQSKLLLMAPPLAALRLLNPRSAIILISQCVSRRPGFLLRTAADLRLVLPFATAFDNSICVALEDILRMASNHMTRYRIFLPCRLGGMGITRHAGLATENGQLASQLAVLSFLGTYRPTERCDLQQYNFWSHVHPGTTEGLQDLTGLSASDVDSMTAQTCRPRLATAKKAADDASLALALAALSDNGHFQAAANLRSSTNSTFAFCMSSIGIDNPLYFSPGAFRATVRARLGVGPTNEPQDTEKRCPCDKRYDAGTQGLHGLSCRLNGHFATRRHHQITKTLAALLRRTQPAPVAIEALAGVTAADHDIIADIKWSLPEGNSYIDVAVVDPGADSYTTTPFFSHLNTDAAALFMERRKRTHYARIVPAPNPLSIIPFVVEATGRLGPSALALIARLCRTHTHLKSQFLTQLSMICAITAGNMLEASRDRFLSYPQNGTV